MGVGIDFVRTSRDACNIIDSGVFHVASSSFVRLLSQIKSVEDGYCVECSFSTKQCKDIFGPQFTVNVTEAGISWTNTNYGGLTPQVTRIVFPNGSTDPWHALGITQDLSPNATAIFIKGQECIS